VSLDYKPYSCGEREWIPLSALNHFVFCPRRAALIHLEQIFLENVHTVEGDIVHERVDTPGYHVARGVKVLRALSVWSDKMGLTGKCDVVEKHADGTLVPVEFKKSQKKDFLNDDVQVCAQAMCLEETLGINISKGAIFFAASKHRRDVELTPELRQITEKTAQKLHSLLDSGITPTAERQPKCRGCSLVEVCMPDALRFKRGAAEWFQSSLTQNR
jgi:CRISPR-associated exonuclease Cas4